MHPLEAEGEMRLRPADTPKLETLEPEARWFPTDLARNKHQEEDLSLALGQGLQF